MRKPRVLLSPGWWCQGQKLGARSLGQAGLVQKYYAVFPAL